MTGTYEAFLASRTQAPSTHGFTPTWLPEFLYGFQRDLVDWAVDMGRGALFADCGLGKTPMELVWAENVRRHTGKPVLLVAPLAVSFQTELEAEKFGGDAAVSRTGKVTAGVTITNYERLESFDPADFGGVVCDESSAIKAFDGQRRAIVTEFLRLMPYRLLCTATAAPNDYIELGTSSEALGQLGYMDMLTRFFTNSQKTNRPNRHWDGAQWRFKGHAEDAFWRWVTSWARAVRRPSDLGHDDAGFVLPPLDHVIQRAVVLWSNPGERVLTPFMGVGSEVYEPVRSGRFGVGIELKPTYYRQAVRNLEAVSAAVYSAPELPDGTPSLFEASSP